MIGAVIDRHAGATLSIGTLWYVYTAFDPSSSMTFDVGTKGFLLVFVVQQQYSIIIRQGGRKKKQRVFCDCLSLFSRVHVVSIWFLFY